MNKTGIAIISGLVGVAAATAVTLAVTLPRDNTPQITNDTTVETTLPAPDTATIPVTDPTQAGPAAPETTSEATTTAAPETLPAAAPTTTVGAQTIPAPAPTTVGADTLPAAIPAADEITKEEAEAIALAHAGLTASEVRFARTEYDREYNRNEWEVEFYKDRTEYNYTINAATGEILEYEIDND
jgi:hypothetical protein